MKVSEGLLYGYGVFETIKVVDAKPQYLAEHFYRMQNSCLCLDIAFNLDLKSLTKQVAHEITNSDKATFILRFSLIKDGEKSELIFTRRDCLYTPEMYERGFKLTISDIKRNETSPLVYHKTCNYLDHLLELKKAKQQGFNEVLFFNTQGYMAECATSNIFLVKDNNIYTPKIESGILNGIMREQVITQCKNQELDVQIQNITQAFLSTVDEIFITNSVLGIMPISEMQSVQYKSELTSQLRKSIEKECRGI